MDISWQLHDVDIVGRITALQRTGADFMIGITAVPEERVEDLEVGGEAFDEMHVLYQTRSKSEVRRLLSDLSDHHDGYRDSHKSSSSGPPFYLYTLRQTD
jgi:hypothetical protein